MRKNRNYRRVILSLALIFGLGLVVFPLMKNNLIKKVSADVNSSGRGWLWGGSEEFGDGLINGNETGVGWISINSANCDIDGNRINDNCDMDGDGDVADDSSIPISDYGVSIPQSSCESDGCNLIGYAWSSNLSWIDFNPQDHCGINYSAASCFQPNSSTLKGGVSRSGNSLNGWARVVGIAQASAIDNSGGWDGWISLNDESGSSNGVTIDDTSGSLSGYGWNGEADSTCANPPCGLGWIDFSGASVLGPPVIDLKVNEGDSGIILLKPGESLPKTATLSWTVTGSATSCIASNEWEGEKNVNGDSEGVQVKTSPATYTLTCSNNSGSDEDRVTVLTGCNEYKCSASTCAESFITAADSNDCEVECSADADCNSGTNMFETN